MFALWKPFPREAALPVVCCVLNLHVVALFLCAKKLNRIVFCSRPTRQYFWHCTQGGIRKVCAWGRACIGMKVCLNIHSVKFDIVQGFLSVWEQKIHTIVIWIILSWVPSQLIHVQSSNSRHYFSSCILTEKQPFYLGPSQPQPRGKGSIFYFFICVCTDKTLSWRSKDIFLPSFRCQARSSPLINKQHKAYINILSDDSNVESIVFVQRQYIF